MAAVLAASIPDVMNPFIRASVGLLSVPPSPVFIQRLQYMSPLAASCFSLYGARRAFSAHSSLLTRQCSLPAAYYRGGTSRAVFFKQDDLPKDRSQWDEIFRRVLGSPDPYGRQLDGLGGGISSLSKVCVVGKSEHPEADVDYTFAALGIRNDKVDFSANCGNMTSAVGPFAVDSQVISPEQIPSGPGEQTVELRILNTNTGKIIRARFPVIEGEAVATGEFAIDGVAGTAAQIQLDFIDPAGSRTGKLLPTGKAIDVFDGIRTTCIDVSNPACFVLASDLNVDGTITPAEMEAQPELLDRLESIRRQAGVAMGLADSPELVPQSIPKVSLLASPGAAGVDIVVRAISVGQPHKAVPITVALALAVATKVAGSVAAEVARAQPVTSTGTTLGHSSGSLVVGAEFQSDGKLSHASVFRTARRLMEGRVFWKP